MNKLLAIACLLATSTAAQALPTDCSLALTNGGQAQWIIGTGVAGHGFMIQNIDSREALWYSLTGVAKGGELGSFILPPAQAKGFATDNLLIMMGTFDFTGSVSVVAPTAGHKISCARW